MASDHRPFMPAFKEVKVDQITENRTFSISAMITTSLQPGINLIRFLRRSISLHTVRPGALVSDAPPKPLPLSEANVPTVAQEPLITKMLQQNGAYQDPESKAIFPRLISRVLYSESVGDDQAIRRASGVHWNLVNISVDGGRPAVAEEDVTFERKAFIDGVTYLLEALPQDLDVCELRRVQSALPEDVKPIWTWGLFGLAILHRGVRITVVNLIFFLSFLMPYLIYLLRYAARTERKYKVSETLVSHGLDFVNSIGKQGVPLTESTCQMNDRKVRLFWKHSYGQLMASPRGYWTAGLSIMGPRGTV
ncbi:hypothetical protein EDB80DRAFT_872946 [Ilyonectria destructans]|nr:hypothetical protein EDB80DRAFT_872946 [Ilyonectria destructans]